MKFARKACGHNILKIKWFMLLLFFMQIGWWKMNAVYFFSVGKLKFFTLHNSSSSVSLNDCLYLWFLFCGVAWRMEMIVTTLMNMSLPNHTASYMWSNVRSTFDAGAYAEIPTSTFQYISHPGSNVPALPLWIMPWWCPPLFVVLLLPLVFLVNHTSSLAEQAFKFWSGSQETAAPTWISCAQCCSRYLECSLHALGL